MKLKINILILLFFTSIPIFAQSFTLVGEQTQAKIFISPQEPDYVRLAVEDLVSDVEKITDKKLLITNKIADCKGNCVVVGSQNVPTSQKIIQKIAPSFAKFLAGKWEAYLIQSFNNQLVISGSDERGTMFGVYHFIEEYLGIDPMYFWSDLPPPRQTQLSWAKIDLRQDVPTFKFRGCFINDEDLLTEWIESGKKRDIDYPFYSQVVAPEAMRQVAEALVRLRYNLLIPASFVDIRQPAEAALVQEASRRGLFVSMHHVEPLGVSAFTYFNYWKEKGKSPLFSFFSNRAELEEVWKIYVGEWAKYPNVIWQVGLRGIADRPMWMADPNTPQTDADRGKLISDAMQWQVDLIKKVSKDKKPLITTTLWAEGSTLNQAGYLKIPQEVITIFADNSPGWRMQKDFWEMPREKNKLSGIYYHHQLWGSGPHLAQAVPPKQTYKVLQDAVNKGDTVYAILNISNVREFQLGLNASAKMLYSFKNYNTENAILTWAEKRFRNGKAVAKAYQAYFEAFELHEERKVPFLLDGQMRIFCLEFLQELKLQFTDSVAYQKRQLAKKEAEVKDSFWASIGDMSPRPRTTFALLQGLARQKDKHLETQMLVYEAIKGQNKHETHLLNANLLAHLEVMLGMEKALEGIILAKIAAESNLKIQVQKHLAEATVALAQVQEAKRLGTISEKWKYWYRGDKKMNVSDLEKKLEEVMNLVK
jgi:hypothetical protein